MRRLFYSYQPEPRRPFGKRLATSSEAVSVILKDTRSPATQRAFIASFPDDRADPTATEAAAYVGTKLAEYAGYAVLAVCLLVAWIGSPA